MNEPNRSEKIDALVDDIDKWEFDTLIQWAKDIRRQILEKTNDYEINEAYKNIDADWKKGFKL